MRFKVVPTFVALALVAGVAFSIVLGEYTQIQCPHDNITTDCFQGTLDILRGTKH